MIRIVTFPQILGCLMLGVITLFSCQEESDLTGKGFVQFGIHPQSQNARVEALNPSAIFVTIKDAEGNIFYNLKKIPLVQIGDQYITETLEFVEGDFTIKDFIVIDGKDSAIYITPKVESEFADIVNTPLPYHFTVVGKETSSLVLDVIPVDMGTALQFGYATISFNIISPLEHGLVAYYPFTGNANDLMGNSLHATVSGATLTTDRDGNANRAYLFDGTDDKITGKTDNMNINDELSISCWIKTSDATSPHIVGKYDWTVDRGYTLRLIEGVPYIDGRDGNGQFIRCGDESVQVNDGEWHHLAATVKKNEWSLFLDGEIIRKLNTSNESVSYNTDIPLSIGYYYQGNEGHYRYLDGSIDEVRIYNRALTLYEISKLAGETF